MNTRRDAQSDVIGVVLLTAVIVVVVSVTGAFVLDRQAQQIQNQDPLAQFGTELESSTLTIQHTGGESIELSNLVLILRSDTSEQRYELDDPADRNSDTLNMNTIFETAESITVSHSFTESIRILLIHTSSGSVLYEDEKQPPSSSPGTATPTPTPTPTATPTPANFEVTIDSTNSPVTSGNTVEVTATITNSGGQSSSQTIQLDIQGQSNPVDTQTVPIASGDSTTITLEWQTSNNAHNNSPYTATVSSNDNSDSTQITVQNSGRGGGN